MAFKLRAEESVNGIFAGPVSQEALGDRALVPQNTQHPWSVVQWCHRAARRLCLLCRMDCAGSHSTASCLYGQGLNQSSFKWHPEAGKKEHFFSHCPFLSRI